MSVKIRNLILGEELPERLRTGYESGETTDPEWIWIAEREGKAVGILVMAPMHIVVILVRIVATEEAIPTDIRALLVAGVREIKQRGYKGYVAWLDPTVERERTLAAIIKDAGGFQLPNPQLICGGAV